MDYKQNQFMRMQQYQYAPQVPFYMSYPQNIYMTELEYDRDMERMKELYPEEAKQIQGLVEEECDKLEYEGSMMFDEYPDRVTLKIICDRIYQKALQPRIQEAEIQGAEHLVKSAGMAGPGIKNPEIESPGMKNLGNENPGVEDLGNENPGVEDLGNENPGMEDLGMENPGTENAVIENQKIENPGMDAGQMEAQAYRPGRPPGPPPGPGWPPGPGRPPGPPPGPGWPPGPGRPPGPPPPPPGRPNNGLGSLIEVLLYNEMYKRRCRHNRCRRWW